MRCNSRANARTSALICARSAALLESVWGGGCDADVHLLRMTIRNLRHRLEAAAPGESYITTEYGVGYRLVGSLKPVS